MKFQVGSYEAYIWQKAVFSLLRNVDHKPAFDYDIREVATLADFVVEEYKKRLEES